MLTKCPECKMDVSDKAKACPNCGFPLQSAPTTKADESLANTTGGSNVGDITLNQFNREEINKNLAQRITTSQPEATIKALIGKKFKDIEPSFDPQTLTYVIGNSLFTQVTARNISGNDWIINVDFQEDDKDEQRYGYFVMGGLFLYNLFAGKMGWAFSILFIVWIVSMLKGRFGEKLTSESIEVCLRNIKAELDQT